MDHKQLLADILGGHRLSINEAISLLSIKDRNIFDIVSAADTLREEKVGDVVTYVRNQNIHITNICKNLCGFCSFGRRAGDEGAFCDDRDTLVKKTELAMERGVTEICLLSGVHPEFTADTYTDILGWVRDAAPGIHLHAFSPDEVAHAASRSGISTAEVLERFKEAGIGSLQGTAAEILVDDVRDVICPRKGGTQMRYPEYCNNHVRFMRECCGPGGTPLHITGYTG
jgi:FO synthase subunit 2